MRRVQFENRPTVLFRSIDGAVVIVVEVDSGALRITAKNNQNGDRMPMFVNGSEVEMEVLIQLPEVKE